MLFSVHAKYPCRRTIANYLTAVLFFNPLCFCCMNVPMWNILAFTESGKTQGKTEGDLYYIVKK